MKFAISDEAIARVYSAAYSSSGEHKGMEARTIPATARSNAREAVLHFVQVMHEIHGERPDLPNDQQQGETK